jgi:hypothetical protein
LIIVLLGAVIGGVVNPAREFGPAVFAGRTTDLWICLTAPIVGAVLGAGLHDRRFKTRQPLTYKLAGSRVGRPAKRQGGCTRSTRCEDDCHGRSMRLSVSGLN